MTRVLDNLKDTLKLSPRVKRFYLNIALLSAVFEAIKLIPPFVFKEIIDRLVEYDPSMGLTIEVVLWLLMGYAGSLFLMTLVELVFTRAGEHLIRDAEQDITIRALRKLLGLDIHYHEKHATGTSVNKVLKGGTRITELFYYIMHGFFPTVLQALFTLIILAFYGWQIGLVFLVFVPVFAFILMRGAKMTQATREEYHKHHDRFAGTVTQSVANIRTVKDFDNVEHELKNAKSEFGDYIAALIQRIRLGLKNRVFEDGIVAVARVLTLALSVMLLLQGKMSPGTLVLVVTLAEKAFANLARLYRIYYQAQDVEPSIARLMEIRNAPIAIADNPSGKARIAAGSITFDHVWFSYPESKLPALKDVGFAVRSKQTVALVGRSGSGKSTVAKLLLRHYDVKEGHVKIDGKDVREYKLSALRHGIAVVSQDVELFNDTIGRNIAYGAPDAPKKKIIDAAKLAHIHEFIMSLPNGYDTIVGERGVKLSGGQKQRVAIARALIRKPKILVFDEATASLDAESEGAIHQSILGLTGKVTLVIIAHRFSTIQHADMILLLDKGKIAERGTQEQLVKKEGIFARLRKLQELR